MLPIISTIIIFINHCYYTNILFFKNKKNLDGLSIFDVSGHGLASGLVTMPVKNCWRAEQIISVSSVTNNINNHTALKSNHNEQKFNSCKHEHWL